MEQSTAQEASVTPNGDTPLEPDAPAAEESSAEHRSTQELYRFSEWVHVGPGADQCEERENSRCSNPMHFHAWCRLPNPFQHQAIREKAMAAKARRVRQYRQPDSDLSAILDGELDEVEATLDEDAARQAYIEEIVHKNFMRDYFEVIQELKEAEPEGDEETAKFATIDEDSERWKALNSMSEEDRPAEEYEELRKHIAEFNQEVERIVREERQVPEREALAGRPLDELRAMVREQRISVDARQEYLSTYQLWEQYIGTLKPRDPSKGLPTERVFGSIEHFKAAAPEVVEALERTFTNLDSEFGRSVNVVPGEALAAMGKSS